MKLKVLYIITKSETGGAQKYVQDLANNLNQNSFEAKILYGGCDLRWLSNKVRPWAFFINDWLAIWELVKTYQKEQPNIIHLNSSKAGVLGSVAAKIYSLTLRLTTYDLRPKVIFTAHGWVFNPTNSLPAPIRWSYIIFHKISALFQNQIICVSEYDLKLANQCRIAPPQKLTAIHNGIDPNIKFLDKETARKELIKKLGPRATNYALHAEWPWIGSVGRLVKEKNYETFIQAANLVPNAYFFIIGAGPEYESYKLLVKGYKLENRFFFIEPTGNDAQYLKALDVFVMSSIKEGLPYILLEAMLAELPIVVTETGGMPEMIKNNESGFLVAQKSPQLLAQAINGLIANPGIAKNLKQLAQKSAKEKFSLPAMIRKTESVYIN